MSMKLESKLFLYRFFKTKAGRMLLKSLGVFVSVKNLFSFNKAKNHPFLVAITVDTESGYVEKNERRVWQRENPEVYIGYYCGIKNLLDIFKKHNVKATFFLSTNCFSSKGSDNIQIKKVLKDAIELGHEIGLHLHPDSDIALQKKLGKTFNATSAFFYSYEEKFKLIKAAKSLIEENLGKDIARKLVSFRWGNWALDSEGAKALNKLGFSIDSSATPGIKGHTKDNMKFDWSKVKRHYPWKLSTTDYQSTDNDNSGIIEIPIATFDLFGVKLRADPLNSVLLDKAFEEYYNKADRSKSPFPFVVITHSPEATTKEGKYTQTLVDLDRFISFAKKYDNVKFVTLEDAGKGYCK
jgi:peptidoglycan/xylan/chitin deacetylase (PgdA/CDA1 family)